MEPLEGRILLSLIGVVPGYPVMTYDSTGAINYNAASQDLTAHATPLFFRETGLSTPRPVVIPIGMSSKDVSISIIVGNDGNLVSGVAGDDLKVIGQIDINGDGSADVSGTLLTGEILQFGYQDVGTTDSFDFVFRPTGGALLSYPPVAGGYAGKNIGVTLSSEHSSFAGSFLTNFNGGAKGNIGTVPGNQEPASLGDFVWEDLNGNGQQDSGEPGIAGVNVTLTGAGPDATFGTADDTTANQLTNVGGGYLSTGLAPGKYQVTFDSVGGYTRTAADVGSDVTDSDANAGTGQTGVYTLASGDSNLTVDAGYYKPATIGDFVWLDTNANGVQDAGENGIAGATVTLFTSGGTQVGASQTTGADGLYLFTGLTPGNYYVQVTPPAGYLSSPQDQGGDDTKDSDADVSTGKMAVTTLISGEDDRTWDAGVYQTATIGDFVWHDLNANGVQDAGEPGIDGVGVRLYNAANLEVGSTTTSGGGLYLFSGLTPGDYHVEFDAVAGYVRSPQDTPSDDAKDSDANAAGVAIATTLVSGETDLTWDAGYYQPAAIGDYVWEDLNANGIQDTGETGIDGVTVNLFDAGNTLVGTQSTTGGGLYLFSGLTPGDYHVQFVAPGWEVSPANQGGDDAVDSDGLIAATTTLVSGETDLTWDQGLYHTAALGDYVWNDLNANGVQDAGEPGIDGVGVRLYDAGNNLVASQTTSDGGLYLFSGLTPGDYHVEFDAVAGYVRSPQDTPSDDAKDSDANAAGVAIATTLVSGETDLTWDAGYYKLVTVGDFVWVDTNANGVQDTGEPGIAGVTLTLTGTNGAGAAVADHATTDASGKYLFTETPGSYTVTVDAANPALSGYVSTVTGQGTTATDSNVNPSGTTPVTLPGGSSDLTLDFGYYQLATVGNYVWLDANVDGIQNDGNTGINGVTLTLTGTDGAGNAVTLHTTTLTNAGTTGYYQFANLAPGTYTVTVDASNFTGAGVLAALAVSPTLAGSDRAVDSNVSPSGTAPASLPSGGSDQTIDFAYYEPGGGILPGIDLEKYVKKLEDCTAEGFTPGFWKQCQHFQYWVGFKTTDKVETVFGINIPCASPTLLDALSTGGGGSDALLRHAVAALLNAANPNVAYAYTIDQVIAMVKNAFATGNFETTKNLLATQNELEGDITGGGKGACIPGSDPGLDADTPTGPVVPVGGKVMFTYVVANTGDTALANVTLVDDNATPGDTADDFNPAPVLSGGYNVGDPNHNNVLDIGESWKYTATALVTYGQHRNMSVVTGTPVDAGGGVIGANVTDSDPAHWLGAWTPVCADIDVEKYVKVEEQTCDPKPGCGSWDYSGCNHGGSSCGSWDYSGCNSGGSGWDQSGCGSWDYNGCNYGGSSYGDDADSPTGPSAPVGSKVVFTYIVKNTGKTALANVILMDDNGTALDTADDFAPTAVTSNGFNVGDVNHNGLLEVGESWKYTATGVVAAGQNSNMATVVGTPVDKYGNVIGADVTDKDPAYWYGAPTYKPASLSGIAYVDCDNDGKVDSGETRLAGVTVRLTGTDVEGKTVDRTAVTGKDGSYSFANLKPGTYKVTETQPSGYFDGKDRVGSLGGTLGNDVVSGIVLRSGDNGANYNFGELEGGSLSGKVFLDGDNDGRIDCGDKGIKGVKITLTGVALNGGTSIVLVTYTDCNGQYSFGNLAAGTYTITECQPSSYKDGKDTVGSLGGTLGSDKVSNISVGWCEDGYNYNFAEVLAKSGCR